MTASTSHGPQLRSVQMSLVRPNAPVIGRVVKNELCTASRKAAAFTRHVEIDVSGTPLAGNWVSGQSFGVLAPGADAAGKGHKCRLYSISSPSFGECGNGNTLSTTVKRVVDEHWDSHKLFLGVCSNYLCDLQVGDEVRVSGPNGKRFVLPERPSEHDYVFVATGTGIAPFRGMILDLIKEKAESQIWLLMGVPYASDLLYHDAMLKLAAEHPNFHYLTAISREKQADGHDKMYVDGRITTNRDELLPVLKSERALIYVCGIAGMEIGLFKQLATHLAGSHLDQYLQVSGEAMAEIHSWGRGMLNKQIKPTERVFLEVYA